MIFYSVVLEAMSVIQIRGQQTTVHWPVRVTTCFLYVKYYWNLATLFAAFLLQDWSRLAATETVWPMKHKYLQSLPTSALNDQGYLVLPTPPVTSNHVEILTSSLVFSFDLQSLICSRLLATWMSLSLLKFKWSQCKLALFLLKRVAQLSDWHAWTPTSGIWSSS